MRRPIPLAVVILLFTPTTLLAAKRAPAAPQFAADDLSDLLLGRLLNSRGAWEDLVVLCDQVGHRLAGSPGLDRAVAWGVERMKAAGLSQPRAEPVMVPHWERGVGRLELLSPVLDDLPVLALGGSVGTPDGGIEAEVLVVASWEGLQALSDDQVRGRIVLWDVPFTTYGTTVAYRSRGAVEAAHRGAAASLVRSVTPESLNSPHTGAMRYDDAVPKIPGAAVTVEDAGRLHRLQDAGLRPRLRLTLGSKTLPDAPSANVVGEVRGREKPEEIVVIGCHLDSWDVGQGAQDDGAGCVMVLEAARQIAALPVAPRRTVRAVLFTNEENGLAGAKAYAAAHQAELPFHVAAIEADLGAGPPLGLQLQIDGPDELPDSKALGAAMQALAPLSRLLEPLGASRLLVGHGGADVSPLAAAGIPSFGLDLDDRNYWRIHHTEADTIDKIDEAVLRRSAAVMAMAAWWLAEVAEPPRGSPRPAPIPHPG